ncbi:ABC transporter permease subunit [Bacillus sp. BGMRC 2118]|nr:ABC transporter permease subunit [Bacillus sp. BGMRC 2118]
MKIIKNFIYIIIGFVFISATPSLFLGGEGILHGIQFSKQVVEYVKELLTPYNWEFSMGVGMDFKTYPLFPILWERYFYSMKVFAISLIIGIVITYIFLVFVQLLPAKVRKIMYSIIYLLESLPDVFIIVSLQLGIILFFKKTNILLAEIAVYRNDIYLLPVLCLSMIPIILLIKSALFFIKEEETKRYVELARTIGLSEFRIMFVHIFRNVLYSLFYRSKLIFSFMLSNLLIIEYLFNMYGALQFLLIARGAEFIITTTIIFIPFYIYFTVTEKLLLTFIGERKSV